MDRYRTIISAILCALSYEYFSPGLLIAFLPLIGKNLNRSTFYSWGVIYMACLHLFLLDLANDSSTLAAIFIWVLSSLYFGLFYGIGGWALKIIEKKTNVHWALFLPIIWPIIEYLKSAGTFGNTNGNLGIGLSNIIHYLPITSIIGHIGLGILIIMINVLIWQQRSNQYKKTPLMIMIGIFILASMCGSRPNHTTTNQTISVIQTNVEQQKKMNPRYWTTLENNYLDQIKQATGNVIILPETILPTDIEQRAWFTELQKYSNTNNVAILFGTFIDENGTYNGSQFIQPNKPPTQYKKQQLMPFGETLPYRKILATFIPNDLLFSDFKRGTHNMDISIQGLSIRPLICLEGIYSKFYDSNNNSIIAIMANNAWYDDSRAGSKFLKFAKVHAAEFQTTVLVAANSGQSAIISPKGKSIMKASSGEARILTSSITHPHSKSIYHSIPWLGGLLLPLLWVIWIRKKTV